MPKLLLVALVLAYLSVILACSRDDPRPAAQPTPEATATSLPEAAVTPTATPQPTATATPPAQLEQPPDPQGLAPLNFEDPQALLSDLSDGERSCLADNNIGAAQIIAASADQIPPTDGYAIIDCLEDETVLRLVFNETLTATGEVSSETSACIREGFGAIDLRSAVHFTGGEPSTLEAQIYALASFLMFTACLNDEEWNAAAPVLVLGPHDESGKDCLLAELGGPTGFAEALLQTDESGLPTTFMAATTKCGVGFTELTEDSGSGGIGGDSSKEGMGLPPDTLHPVAVDDPDAFLSDLSPDEQSCLSDRGIGPHELLQMTGRSPGGSPETTANIVNCLQDDTVLRLFLTSLVGQVEPFSEETSSCMREGFVPIDVRGLLAPAIALGGPANSLALGMAALNVSVVCMNDDEWAIYAPRLGMQPEDKEGAACLFEELGGPAQVVEAMQSASLGEAPDELTEAFEACGLKSAPTTQ